MMRKKSRLQKYLYMFLVLLLMLSPLESYAASKVKMNKTSVVLTKNESYTLKVLGTKKKPKWYTSSKSKVTVSKSGKITAKKAGVTTITAKVGKKKYTCKVTVPSKYYMLCKGNSLTIKPSDLKGKIKWSTSNKKVCTVSQKGKVTAKNTGSALITARSGNSYYRVKVTVLGAKLNVTKKSIIEGKSYQLKVSGTRSKITWSSSNNDVAAVNSKGLVKGVSEGTAYIKAKIGNGYLTCKATVVYAAHKHNYVKIEEKAPTCTEAGTISYECTGCHDTYTEKVSASGHDYVASHVVEATCEGKGYTLYTCTKNKDHVKKGNFKPALGHSYKEKIIRKAICSENGLKEQYCERCKNLTEVIIPALAHEYVNGYCIHCRCSQKISTANQMNIKVTKDDIVLHMDGIGKAEDGLAQVVRVKPYQYVKGDTISGVSKATAVLGEKVANYSCGTETTITLDRYTSEGFDNLYYKYYVINDTGLLKGPIYPSEIVPERDVKPFKGKSKKGLLHEGMQYVTDTGSSYTAINFDMASMFYPNEDKNGNKIDNVKRKAYAHDFMGTTYYFNKAFIDANDSTIKSFTDNGIGVSLILLGVKNGNWEERVPYSLTYGDAAQLGSLLAYNTSNESGMNYWLAAMDFLAERYSREDQKYGRIVNLVIGNEVDLAYGYNNISVKKSPLDVYMEEYSRTMRLAHLAMSKYMDTVTVSIPTTHYWAKSGGEIMHPGTSDPIDPQAAIIGYCPKEMIDWLNEKTKMEGDYAWGYSPHCYPLSLGGSYGIQDDTTTGRLYGMTNDYNTSNITSFANLEILDEYLHLPEMKCNGEVRKMFLTESGCSSYLGRTSDLKRQAAYIAAAYYKCATLDSVEAFIYYRAIDHSAELKNYMAAGILDQDKNPKPAYEVFKYIDTQYSFKVADPYLNSTLYADEDGKMHTPASYKELMNAFGTNYNWDSRWNLDNIMARKIPPIPEFEDKESIGDVTFTDKSFLYDEIEHELQINGKLPDGLTVKYENNKRTERGSQEAVANFYRDNDLVATRRAKITVGDLMTNKSVYELGEKIFVTAKAESTEQWVGIYRKSASLKDDTSIMWYYVDKDGQISENTYALQEVGKVNTDKTHLASLPAGEYKILLVGKNGEYEVDESLPIVIMDDGKKSGITRLDSIAFESKSVAYNGEEQTLEITGELPEGVTVEYTNNTLVEPGKKQAKVSFKENGRVLETRIAIFEVYRASNIELTTNKTEYEVGEPIMVTAKGNKADWVGIYRKDDVIGEGEGTQTSIYWYNVADANGIEYNIKDGTFNPTREEYRNFPAGEYKILLLEDGGYNILKQVNITIKEAGVVEPDITTNKTEYEVGEPIMVTAKGNGNDWVGIYLKDDVVGTGEGTQESIYWYNVLDANGVEYNIKNGTFNPTREAYRNLPEGEYKVVLLEDGGYNVLKQVNITIKKAGVVEPDITTNKTEYEVGEPIMVTAKGNGNDWVGIYLKDDVVGTGEGTQESIYWYNVLDANGVEYNIKNGTFNPTREAYRNLPEGEYKVVLLEDGGYNVLKQVNITVKAASITEPDNPYEDPTKLKTDKKVYYTGEDIFVTAAGEATKGAWVGLYKKEDPTDGSVQSIYWYYVIDEKHQSGQRYKIQDQDDSNCNSTVPNAGRVTLRYLPAGEYKLVLTPENGSYGIAAEADFVIKESSETASSLITQGTYAKGSPITVQAKATHEKDWVAIFKDGVDIYDKKAVYEGYSYVNNAGITVVDTAGKTLDSGKYVVVLFGEDQRYILASRQITIQ